jgi:signal peptidase I
MLSNGVSDVNLGTTPPPRNPSPLSFGEVSASLLSMGCSLRFRATGKSMYPTIRDGEVVTVVPVARAEIRRGDIVLYRSETGVIAHRVERVRRNSGRIICLHLRGDASDSCDRPVQPEHVLGRVQAVERSGQQLNLAGQGAKIRGGLRAIGSRWKRRMTLRS